MSDWIDSVEQASILRSLISTSLIILAIGIAIGFNVGLVLGWCWAAP